MSSFWGRVYTETNVAKDLQHHEDSHALLGALDSEPDDASHALLGASGENPQQASLKCDTGPRSKSGRKKEREMPSPESISYKTLQHCLLGDFQAISEEDKAKCWEELDHILNSCGRLKSPCAS